MGHEQLRLPEVLTAGMIRTAPPPIDRTGGARPIIAALRAQGLGWHATARRLNDARVPTPSGRGIWRSETAMRHAHPDAHAAYMRAWRAGVRRR
jgi:hypothetical protein